MQLSIIVPAYNEARRLRATLEHITAFCSRELDAWEVIVVDDGSLDDTAAIAESFAASFAAPAATVRCLRNPVNRGKGESVRCGMLAAALDPVLFTDADLSTPIEEALALLHAIRTGGADIAIASRVRAPGKRVRRKWFRRIQAAVFRALVKLVVLRGIEDTQCGFKMFRRDVARDIFPRGLLGGWAFDVEILFLARCRGYRIAQVPVDWQESAASGLKIWSPLQMVWDLLRIRWYRLRGRYGGLVRSPAVSRQLR